MQWCTIIGHEHGMMADWQNMRLFSNAKSKQFIKLFLHGRAHETFKEQIAVGKDGRPDFAARKACNYMETAIQVNPTLRVSSSIMADGCSLSISRYELWKSFRCYLLISENLFRLVGTRWKENASPTTRWIYFSEIFASFKNATTFSIVLTLFSR